MASITSPGMKRTEKKTSMLNTNSVGIMSNSRRKTYTLMQHSFALWLQQEGSWNVGVSQLPFPVTKRTGSP